MIEYFTCLKEFFDKTICNVITTILALEEYDKAVVSVQVANEGTAVNRGDILF